MNDSRPGDDEPAARQGPRPLTIQGDSQKVRRQDRLVGRVQENHGRLYEIGRCQKGVLQ